MSKKCGNGIGWMGGGEITWHCVLTPSYAHFLPVLWPDSHYITPHFDLDLDLNVFVGPMCTWDPIKANYQAMRPKKLKLERKDYLSRSLYWNAFKRGYNWFLQEKWVTVSQIKFMRAKKNCLNRRGCAPHDLNWPIDHHCLFVFLSFCLFVL